MAPPWLLWLHTVSRRVMVTWRNIVHLVSYIEQCDGQSVCYRQPVSRVRHWAMTVIYCVVIPQSDISSRRAVQVVLIGR